MTNVDSILKSRDIILPMKVCLVKAMVFPEVMYGCKSWTIKCQRIDAFEVWCWRRLLRVPWTSRRSNQSILKIGPGCSLEGMMLKLKLQYFGHLMQNAGLGEAQAGIETAGRNTNNLRHADGTTLTAESEEELKSFSMKVKAEREKPGLKLNIQKTKIMASGPIVSWQIDGESKGSFSH